LAEKAGFKADNPKGAGFNPAFFITRFFPCSACFLTQLSIFEIPRYHLKRQST
jgi:hypothetical protein